MLMIRAAGLAEAAFCSHLILAADSLQRVALRTQSIAHLGVKENVGDGH